MNSQQKKGQTVQDDHYSNLTPKEKPSTAPGDPIRNPKFSKGPNRGAALDKRAVKE